MWRAWLAKIYIYIQVQGKQQGRERERERERERKKKQKGVWSFELEKIRDGSKWGGEGSGT
jgi:hypothetical protein